MAKKIDYQGEIINEVRKARAKVGREFREDKKKFLAHTKKIATKYGLKFGTPKKKNSDEAA